MEVERGREREKERCIIIYLIRLQLFAGTFFCGFEILCILLVLNFAQASQLMIFMMVCSPYLIFISVKFCTFGANPQKYKMLIPAKKLP